VQFALGPRLPQERHAEAGSRVPVDLPDIVSGAVRAVLIELETLSAQRARVAADAQAAGQESRLMLRESVPS